ncbi:autotransporter strand-loop-strand O-heptosyltransferase [Escherichia coli]|jgi:autotransporter strand-loop-strand O-heptosyltransferase|uniref:autotransporter strand-loop-strand O-heptosyltransferase n=1 Tax=Escherichia coli TaxID=562 RepID=UPI00079FFEC2|nr:autotransporter strand-loop-strand O-heptosyltransferase [Escherichia coli]EER9344972.1 autotransporter strand-loop-strand O-heptosyltransferase [Escherichia coli]EER9664425.1 autotransporter strand-loop-strand O-heptosyltransferase [Escherichia coli]EES5635896.1 autotransporter strand-loop-strand O-heptosyltransferase [Escherichia coli]EET0039057.1 autotransporter strand-loop-strand O-heptosyltransferase [Escherichia coli]EET3386996.1 autotransporter strand-loop-strand O-heptosyltransferas
MTTNSFIAPPEVPTQAGPENVFYDFNDGARILLPEGKWHVRIIDDESGNILFASDVDSAGWVVSNKKYFVLFRIQVFRLGENTPFIDETMNLSNRRVLISFPVGTLGDILAWFPYVERFRVAHNCRIESTMAQNLIDILAPQYPDIRFSVPERVRTLKPYASWRLGLFFGGNDTHQPIDFRQVGLHRTAGYILGVDTREEPVRLNLSAPRIIPEPYVCIAVQASSQTKCWNNGTGWSEVVSHLKKLGYRVLCIDQKAHHGVGFVWNHIPREAEDFTGDLPLQERINLLAHASFFIGLGSGLSWLAWACRIPVVLISGFSLPQCEFYTPWRVFNSHGCNGCWDDTSLNFDHNDFFWCPRHKDTPRQFECTRLITGTQVIRMIDRLHLSLSKQSDQTAGIPANEPVGRN